MIHKLSTISFVTVLTLSMLAGRAQIGNVHKDGIRLECVALNIADPVGMAKW